MTSAVIPYTDCMIDLETWGVKDDPIITSIGAVAFNPTTPQDIEPIGGLPGSTFEVHIDIGKSIDVGLSFSVGTLLWWMAQSDESRHVLIDGQERHAMSPFEATSSFSAWFSTFQMCGVKRVWANGNDLVWMRSLYNVAASPSSHVPWSYKQEQSYRTLRTMQGWEDPPGDTAHSALADAKAQAGALVRWQRELRNYGTFGGLAL